MGSNATDEMFNGHLAAQADTTIEIKVMTMDFNNYTLRVNKHVAVEELKQEIATITGVPPDQQRLIWCGRALSNNQLLSSYNVEDGHTLHLVDRQPPSVNTSAYPAPVHFSSTSTLQGTDEVPGVLTHELEDSLTTMFHYLRIMRQQFGDHSNSNFPRQERVPRPEVLAEILLATRDFIINQISQSFLQLARILQNNSNMNSPRLRRRAQSIAWRNGTRIQNLGSFLLELGRANTTLNMGPTPDGAIVNAGPPVFISQFGPNSLLVQSTPVQLPTSFGPTSMGPNWSGPSGLANHSSVDPTHIGNRVRRDSWDPLAVYRDPYSRVMNSASEARIGQVPINNLFFANPASERGPLIGDRASGESSSSNSAAEEDTISLYDLLRQIVPGGLVEAQWGPPSNARGNPNDTEASPNDMN